MENSQQLEEIEALSSIYGNDFQKEIDSYVIQISPEVKLFLTLNPSYPLQGPPSYQLLAPSLNKNQKQIVAASFDEIYLDNIGEPILYQWIEKLKDIVLQPKENEVNFNDNSMNKVENLEENNSNKVVYDIFHGPTIQDRKSIFQGHVCKVHNEVDVSQALSFLLENKKIAQAAHNISAYRIENDGGVLLQDHDDDGETHAGGRLLHLLQILDVKNILVIVTRWYGGIHLGPDRFRHINNAARQVLQEAGYVCKK